MENVFLRRMDEIERSMLWPSLLKQFAPIFEALNVPAAIAYNAAAGGINSAIGFMAGALIDGRSLKETLTLDNPIGLASFAITVGIGLGAGGAATDRILDAGIAVAGTLGAFGALQVIGWAENSYDMIRDYRDQIDPNDLP